tara:strand:- start:4231 stop:5019 length:789 start_codon:yes stop_codon:yes gene_type:complete
MKLTGEQTDFWNNNSYLIFRGLFKNDIQNIARWIEEVSNWPNEIDKWLNFYEMDDPNKLSRIENFVPFHEGLAKIINGPLLNGVVASLMGTTPVLYKDRINFKPSGGGAHAAHQDGVAYESGSLSQFEANSIPYISVLISVDPATISNGCFEVVKGWGVTNLNILPMERPYPNHPNFSKIKQEIEDELDWVQLETHPGDAILFTERLPHRSGVNRSLNSRRILYGVYNPLSEGDKRDVYFRDKRNNINDARYMVGNPHAPVT